MKYYLEALKKYAVFSGRARRKEYWFFALFNLIFAIVAMFLDQAFGTVFTIQGVPIMYGFIYVAYALFTFLPGLAVTVRRLHDVGKSGWFFFIVLIPVIGAIWLLVLMCTAGQPGMNKWGQNPKEDPAELELETRPL